MADARDARDRAPRVRNRAPAPIQVGLFVKIGGIKSGGWSLNTLSIDYFGAAIARGSRTTRTFVYSSKAEDSGFGRVERVPREEENRV